MAELDPGFTGGDWWLGCWVLTEMLDKAGDVCRVTATAKLHGGMAQLQG
uniref:Uncharacterized protein n=1 Tax=Oryza sativa subsp. japonica TaxID=39947 RepID=Q10I86_ORYSJ|nr:hypothetical protein LOC_Os03g36264 [Oryza sativa Japonica Group]